MIVSVGMNKVRGNRTCVLRQIVLTQAGRMLKQSSDVSLRYLRLPNCYFLFDYAKPAAAKSQ